MKRLTGKRWAGFTVGAGMLLSIACQAQQDLPAPSVYTNPPGQRARPQTQYGGPFSDVGIAVKAGTEGIGFDIATPLGRKVNLRGSASFIDYTPNFQVDGINYDVELHFKSGQVTADWFPFGGGFHISPGIYFGQNNASGSLAVPGGTTFTLGDQQYTGSSTDPVHGGATVNFPNNVGPVLLMGWGNIIPRSGRHWSVPFEIGGAYLGQSTIALTLAGTACTNQGGVYTCVNAATDPTTQQNLRQEQTDINNDLNGLKFFPIISIGLGYRF